jgi:hypothetical protein
MSFLPLLLATVAFVLLGLGTDTHHRRRFGACPDARRRRMLRTGGWLALVATTVPAILAQGLIFGSILYVGAIMSGAGITFLALNLIPARDDARY